MAKVDNSKEKALEAAMSHIQKAYGPGSIMRLGDGIELPKIDTISTGSLKVDEALGIRGLPKGRIVEIFGPESSGKTTLTLQAIAQCQKKGGIAAFVDAEHALDLTYAAALGVKTDELLVSQPDTGEQALEITETLVRSGAIDMLIVDSVAALVPRAEIEGEMGDSHVGLQARLMSQALRKLTSAVASSNCCVVFINQLRMKIGVVYGSPETTTGGNALKFYASIRIDIRAIGALKHGDQNIGKRTRVKVIKNKLAPPFRQAEVDVLFGKGIDPISEAIELAVEHEIIEKSGAWYTYNDDRFQGMRNLQSVFEDDAASLAQLREDVLKKMYPEEVVEEMVKETASDQKKSKED